MLSITRRVSDPENEAQIIRHRTHHLLMELRLQLKTTSASIRYHKVEAQKKLAEEQRLLKEAGDPDRTARQAEVLRAKAEGCRVSHLNLQHRLRKLRQEARHLHLAMGMLRGRPYLSCEHKTRVSPQKTLIANHLLKVLKMGLPTVVVAIQVWIEDGILIQDVPTLDKILRLEQWNTQLKYQRDCLVTHQVRLTKAHADLGMIQAIIEETHKKIAALEVQAPEMEALRGDLKSHVQNARERVLLAEESTDQIPCCPFTPCPHRPSQP